MSAPWTRAIWSLPCCRRCTSAQVEIVTGEAVVKIVTTHGHASGVLTERASYAAPLVVNCAGAWAAQIAGAKLPTLPVKGHMVALAFPEELAMNSAEREAEARAAPRPAFALVLHHSAQQWTLRRGQHRGAGRL